MTTTETELVNLALDKLDAPTIADLNGGATKTERRLSRMYPHYRDVELRRYRWNFARAAALLTQDAATLDTDYENKPYRFALPNDCLRPLRDEPDGRAVRWELKGRFICSADTTLYLRYIKRITNVSEFDPLFVEALVSRIAFEACEFITGSPAKRAQAEEAYDKAIALAKQVNAIENEAINVSDDDNSYEWLSGRYV